MATLPPLWQPQRSLVGYSSWDGRVRWTEQHLSFHIHSRPLKLDIYSFMSFLIDM